MEQLEKIITTEGAADTAPEGARKINDNFDKVSEAMGETLSKTGDASLTTSSLSTPPTPVNPTSGSTLSLLLGTLWSWISAFVSGDKEVSSATKASRDALGRVISDTYATQDYVDQKVTGVYRPCGSVQDVSALLALTGVKTGDVYDVQQAGTLGDKQVKAGDNVVALADNPSDTQWDILSGTVDLSGYLLKTGDSSNTIVVFSPESGDPTSGGKLSSLVGRIVKKISDIVSGAIAVGKSTQAGNVNGISFKPGTVKSGMPAVVPGRLDAAAGVLDYYSPANFKVNAATYDSDGNKISTTYLPKTNGLATGLITGRNVCYTHHNVAGLSSTQHTGWVDIDFGQQGYIYTGTIRIYRYGKGFLNLLFSAYLAGSGTGDQRQYSWYYAAYSFSGSMSSTLPQVRFVRDSNGGGHILLGGDGYDWGLQSSVVIEEITLGNSAYNGANPLSITISRQTGDFSSLGMTEASFSPISTSPSQGIEVERARKDGNGKDIPSTYATKAEVSSLSIGGVNYITGLKDNWEAGYINQTNGTVTTPDNYNVVTKDYQDISPLAGKRATISASDTPIEVTGTTYYFSLRYAFYDIDKNFLSGGATGNNTPSIVSISVPATAAYIKVSAGVGKYGYALSNFESIRLKLELGDYATDYSLAPQDIPTVNDLPDVYVDTVPSSPKDGDILITTTD